MVERGPASRRKLPEIALEAAMVVFAVLAAFGVDEWRCAGPGCVEGRVC